MRLRGGVLPEEFAALTLIISIRRAGNHRVFGPKRPVGMSQEENSLRRHYAGGTSPLTIWLRGSSVGRSQRHVASPDGVSPSPAIVICTERKGRPMQTRWVKPAFVEIALGGECTAYAGVGMPGGHPTTSVARTHRTRTVSLAPGSAEDPKNDEGPRYEEVSRVTA